MSNRAALSSMIGLEQNRRTMKWMIFVSILAHLAILHAVLPQENTLSSNKDVYDPPIKPTLRQYHPPDVTKHREPVPAPARRPSRPHPQVRPVPQIPDHITIPAPLALPDLPAPDEFDPVDDDPGIFAPEPPNNIVYSIAEVDPPVAIRSTAPVYPALIRKIGLQGSVFLEAVVTRDGVAKDIRVVKSLHKLCDVAAVDALKKWEFQPGTLNGAPVDVRMTLIVWFRLK